MRDLPPYLLALHLSLPIWIAQLPLTAAHDKARLLELLLLVALPLLSRKPLRWPAPTWLLALLLAWSAAACAMSDQPTIALREYALLFGLAVMALTVSEWSSEQMLLLGRLMCWVGVLYGLVFGMTVAIAGYVEGQIYPFALVFGFDNPRHLAHTQTVLIPVAIGVAASTGSSRVQALGWAAAMLAIAVASFLCSRATLLSIGLSFASLALLMRRPAWRYLRWATTAAGVGASLGFGLLLLFGIDLVAQAGSTESGSARLELWRAALDDASQSLFGVGPMHFSRIQRGDAAHPHNAYLQVAAEFGWPAALALVFCVVWALISMARRLRQNAVGTHGVWGMALWTALIAISIDATLSGNLVMPQSQVWVFVTMGFALGWYRGTNHAPTTESATRWLWMRWLVVAPMAVLLMVSAWEYAQPLTHFIESKSRHFPNQTEVYPRFWRDGWL